MDTIYAYTQHLREKLHDDPLELRYIITQPGIGYPVQNAVNFIASAIRR